MTYTPTNWKTGDVVTSSKLNNIEQGIVNASGGSSILKITLTENESELLVMDKTFNEILSALADGKFVYAVFPETEEGYTQYNVENLLHQEGGTYQVVIANADDGRIPFISETANGTLVQNDVS